MQHCEFVALTQETQDLKIAEILDPAIEKLEQYVRNCKEMKLLGDIAEA